MAKIKLDADNLTDDEWEDLLNSVYGHLNANADYPALDPTPAVFNTQKGDFTTKKQNRKDTADLLKSQTTAKNNARKASAASLAKWAHQVEDKTGGDKAAIEALGFQTQADGAPITVGQVVELSLTEGDDAGEIDSHWAPVRGAKNYEVQISTDPNDATLWHYFDTANKSKFTLHGLTSGARIWVRVRANGGSGQDGKGPWSDAVMKIVP